MTRELDVMYHPGPLPLLTGTRWQGHLEPDNRWFCAFTSDGLNRKVARYVRAHPVPAVNLGAGVWVEHREYA